MNIVEKLIKKLGLENKTILKISEKNPNIMTLTGLSNSEERKVKMVLDRLKIYNKKQHDFGEYDDQLYTYLLISLQSKV